MARVTVTNTQTSRYFVPSPVRAFVGAGQTRSFDGVSIPAMEASDAFLQALSDGTITVLVSEDPNVPDAVEAGSQQSAAYGTTLTPTRTEEWSAPDAAVVDAFKLSIASDTADATYTGADLDGGTGLGTISPPRNFVITTTTHADIDAVAVVVIGLDLDGNVLTDTITLVDGGATDAFGTSCFASVSSIFVPLQSGVGGALEFGFGDIIGLAGPIADRAGAPMVMLEIEDSAIVTTGTFATAAVAAPNGSYLAGTIPDDALNYALMYEVAV